MAGKVTEAPGAKIQASPRKLDLGVMPAGAASTQSVTITNTGVLPLIIKKIASRDAGRVYFDRSAEGGLEIAPGASHQFDLVIRPDRAGSFTEVISIDSNAKNAPAGGFSIMVTGKAEG